MWGIILGVRAENWPEYPQIVIYRSPKISHESSVAFGQKTAKIQASGYFEKNRFSTSDPIIKCDMSFLTIFVAWSPIRGVQ